MTRTAIKKKGQCAVGENCYICNRTKANSNGVVCLMNCDVKNLKFCKLYEVQRARKPICFKCRLNLIRCVISLRSTYRNRFSERIFQRMADPFCILCGYRNTLSFMLIAKKSTMRFALKRIVRRHVKQFNLITCLCPLCKLLVTDFVNLYYKKEKEITNEKAARNRKNK